MHNILMYTLYFSPLSYLFHPPSNFRHKLLARFCIQNRLRSGSEDGFPHVYWLVGGFSRESQGIMEFDLEKVKQSVVYRNLNET